MGRTTDALTTVQRAIVKARHLIQPRLFEAQLLAEKGDTAEARQKLQALIAQYPTSGAVMLKQSQVHEQLGEIQAARALLVKAEEVSDEPVTSQLRLAALESRAGEHDAARARLKKLVASAPWFHSGRLALARLDRLNADYGAARKLLESALQENGDDDLSRYELIRVLIAQQEFALAKRRLEEVRATSSPVRSCLHGALLLARGDAGKAFSSLTKGASNQTEDPTCLLLLVRAQLLADRIADAQKMVETMKQRFAGRWQTQKAAAGVQLARANTGAAIGILSKAIGINGRVKGTTGH